MTGWYKPSLLVLMAPTGDALASGFVTNLARPGVLVRADEVIQ